MPPLRVVPRALLSLAVLCGWLTAALCGDEEELEAEADRAAIIQELLARSRLLEDVHFRVARPVWERYVREALQPAKRPPPIAMIAEEGLYALTVPADRKPLLEVTLRLHVFDPERCGSIAALSAALAWEDVRVGGQPVKLATEGGWLRLAPAEPGEHVLTARVPLREAPASGRSFHLAVLPTVRTLVGFESPDAWELTVSAEANAPRAQGGQSKAGPPPARIPRSLRGEAGKGTHGQLALTPRTRLRLEYHPPLPVTERPPRFALRGDVAWNLDAATQQVAAELDVAIMGGRADRLDLTLPPAAERVGVTGPDVREAQVAGGRATVFLRGRIRERTRLRVAYEMPLASEAVQRLGELAVADGHWAGGTLVVTNTAGGTEVLAGTLGGLRQIALGDIPASARAILAGAPAIACEIAARSWSAEVEVLNLGEFALQESIADLAHYELAFRPDGTLVCKASYEIRNRARQFLRLDLPPGATIVQARVNEESCPITPVPGAPDAYLVPLVRSLASVKGLVTFPVDVVFMCRVDGLARGAGFRPFPLRPRAHEVALPLPRIDLPIAYAWCEARVPEKMRVKRWAGPLREVEKYSNETATASLAYGLGMAAEGYTPKARPVPTSEEVAIEDIPVSPEPEEEPEGEKKPTTRLGILGWLGGRAAAKKEPPESRSFFADELSAPARPPVKPVQPPADQPPPGLPEQPPPQPEPSIEPPSNGPVTALSYPAKAMLWKNYYRAGKEFYEKQDYPNAMQSLQQAIALNPKSPEAYNAEKLLYNIKLALGEKRAEAPQSKAEKAAGLQVKRELQADQRALLEQQQEHLGKGLAAAREGREQDAKANLEAAEALGQQLIDRGASQAEQDARLRSAREELTRLRKQEVEHAKVLFKKVQEAKGKGRYEEALTQAKQLKQLDVGGAAVEREIKELATRVVQQKSEELSYKRLGDRLAELNKRVEDQRRKLATYGLEAKRADEDELDLDFDTSLVQPTPVFRGQPPKATDVQKAITYLEKLDAEQREKLSQASAARKPVGGTAGGKLIITDGTRHGDLAGEYARQRTVALEAQKGELKNMLEDGKRRLVGGDLSGAVETLTRVSGRARYLAPAADTAKLAEEANAYLDKALERQGKTQAEREDLRRFAQHALTDRPVVKQLERMRHEMRRLPDEQKAPRPTDDWARAFAPERRPTTPGTDITEAARGHVRERLEDLQQEEGIDALDRGLDGPEPGEALLRRGRIAMRPRPPQPGPGHVTAGDARVRQELRSKRVTFDFVETPLQDVVNFLQDQSDISIVLDSDALRDAPANITLRASDMPAESALGWITKLTGLRYRVVDEVVLITKPESTVDKPVIRMYDVTDLTIDIKNFQKRQQALASDAGYASQRGGQQGQAQQQLAEEFFGDDENGDKEEEPLTGEKLVEFIKKTIPPATWGEGKAKEWAGEEKPKGAEPYTIRYRNGRIVVVHRPEVQEQVERLMSEFRRARGPQVELGRQITAQQAKDLGKETEGQVAWGFYSAQPDASGKLRRDERFQDFVRRNYDWYNAGTFQLHSKGPEGQVIDALDRGPDPDDIANFAEKLEVNRWQKVQVNGINLSVAPAEANGLGIAFAAGNNDVSYAVVDEAQLRTLLELDAAKKRSRVAANPNAQETIVGTDAWLPNSMQANVTFAGEFGNTLTIAGNEIDLLHQKYVLINNGSYLTAVQANPMQYWTEAKNPFPFVVTSQEIGVPRVGRLVKFEKTLVEPGDELVLRASYRYRGD